ncbi:MAG: alpha/beta fold hydrolase [Candidatus Korobacteraceae bacterium]
MKAECETSRRPSTLFSAANLWDVRSVRGGYLVIPNSTHFALPALPPLRSIQVFGQTIKYYDHGQGEPLLLIHGLGAEADVWAYCLEPLSQSHRVIAPDLLGFGRSSKPLINYRVATFVELLDRFLQALAVPRLSLVGNSMGGWIAASFAIQFPERVNKLVLNDAIGIVAGSVEIPIDLQPSSLQNMREVMEFMFCDKSFVSDGLVEMAYELHLERNDGPTIASVLENIRLKVDRLDEQLDRLKVPTLLIWGDCDRISPLSVAENYQRLIAGSKLEVIAQCGHIPPLEKPQELVGRIARFLAE